MNRNENVFLAKKLFSELVFNTAYIEGLNVTFPQTQAILDGAIVNNVPVSEIQTVLNLRDAWRFSIDTIDHALTPEYICKVNEMVSRGESIAWGVFRTGQVSVGGTDYIPPVPIAEEVRLKIEEINRIENVRERAIAYFCYAVRGQLFWDGNKRTSTIVASKILMKEGAGILTIGKANAVEFNTALLEFYDTGENDNLKKCLEKCIKDRL